MTVLPVKTKAATPPPPRLSRGMGKLVSTLAQKSGALDPALAEHWAAIVGSELASCCRPTKLTTRGKVQVLVISVPSGAAAMRVQYSQNDILLRAQRYLRRPALKKIIIEQRGTEALKSRGKKRARRGFQSQVLTGADLPRPPEPSLPPAKDLAEALQRLRRSLSQRPS